MLRLSFTLIILFISELSFPANRKALKQELLAQLPKRPAPVQKKIDFVFDQLQEIGGDSSGWHYNGTVGDYELFGFDSFRWLEKFVKEHPEQENFMVLDIGSAQYAYSRDLRGSILTSSLCRGKNFTIVSLDGEKNLKRGVFEYNKFTLEDRPEVTELRIDQFKVENLYEELLRRKLPTDYDLIVSPTTPTPAFKFGEHSKNPLAMYMNDLATIPANMAGLPAISLPCGDVNGLPVGLQLVGKPLDEATLFQVGHAYQQQTSFHVPKELVL